MARVAWRIQADVPLGEADPDVTVFCGDTFTNDENGEVMVRHDTASPMVMPLSELSGFLSNPEFPPLPSSAAVLAGNLGIGITFSRRLDEASVPDRFSFTIMIDSVPANPGAVTVSDTMVTLDLAIPAVSSLLVSYEQPASSPLQSTDGVPVASFSDFAVALTVVAMPQQAEM